MCNTQGGGDGLWPVCQCVNPGRLLVSPVLLSPVFRCCVTNCAKHRCLLQTRDFKSSLLVSSSHKRNSYPAPSGCSAGLWCRPGKTGGDREKTSWVDTLTDWPQSIPSTLCVAHDLRTQICGDLT
eukprot:TRINITY_DN96362_c1_g2_i2.p1 TRINITY_DN96362_c1_g2~~TRINITY_DN96362_c1_g2_i2.p1  ORF type:complete len:138 (+),score=21.62 TRINITY_DN96362_c1_g2_i2:42-416(+)